MATKKKTATVKATPTQSEGQACELGKLKKGDSFTFSNSPSADETKIVNVYADYSQTESKVKGTVNYDHSKVVYPI